MKENTYGFDLEEIKVQAAQDGKEELIDAIDIIIKKDEAGEDVQAMYDRLAQCWTSGVKITTISPKYLLEGVVDTTEAE